MTTHLNSPRESVVDRFLRYVRIDTQSKEDQTVVPSTQSQWTLANMLAAELEQLGASNVRTSEFCMVYASIPGNLPAEKAVRPIGFIAHVDTSPAVTGTNVNPISHANYQGGDIVLPTDSSQVITVAQNPFSRRCWAMTSLPPTEQRCSAPTTRPVLRRSMTMIDVLMRNQKFSTGQSLVYGRRGGRHRHREVRRAILWRRFRLHGRRWNAR